MGMEVDKPERIREMICKTRDTEGYTPKPILINEDNYFDFEAPESNFIVAVDKYVSFFLIIEWKVKGMTKGFKVCQ